jgi:hypothetical protein
MRTLPPLKTSDPDWETTDENQEELPGRPRRQLLTWWTAVLLALVIGAIGFYVGIRVEKGQTSSSTASARPFPFAGARTGTAPSGPGGFAGAGGGSASFGTVSSISGHMLYVKDASGNTIKVELSSATTVTKSVTVGKKSLRPGDTVVISGLTNKQGTVTATSVRDSGASSSSAPSGSSGGSSTSGSSAVKSLFGSGG